MRLRIYIAGSISDNEDYIEQFRLAERIIRKKGQVPLNPVKNVGFKYKDYIDMGLCELMKCNSILMLKGWLHSSGAMLEHQYANTVGLTVFYDPAEIPFFNEKEDERKDRLLNR